jgi:hypothetical protein
MAQGRNEEVREDTAWELDWYPWLLSLLSLSPLFWHTEAVGTRATSG